MMDYFNLGMGNNTGEPKPGKLLIAAPLLNDPNFSRAVIFLCEHNNEGSVGFVLNQVTELTFSDLLPEQGISSNAGIYNGGPVQADTLHALHRIPEIKESIEVIKGVYWGASYKQLKNILSTRNFPSSDIRLFMGYSGWGQGQLDHEIKEGSWLVADATESLLFETEPHEIWKKAIGLLGKKYSYLVNIPIDPQLN